MSLALRQEANPCSEFNSILQKALKWDLQLSKFEFKNRKKVTKSIAIDLTTETCDNTY